MTQPNTTPRVSLPPLLELRGPSGKLYGELDVKTGVIVFRRGAITERIDLTPYFKVVTIKDCDSR
jgi:hypothetical protein